MRRRFLGLLPVYLCVLGAQVYEGRSFGQGDDIDAEVAKALYERAMELDGVGDRWMAKKLFAEAVERSPRSQSAKNAEVILSQYDRGDIPKRNLLDPYGAGAAPYQGDDKPVVRDPYGQTQPQVIATQLRGRLGNPYDNIQTNLKGRTADPYENVPKSAVTSTGAKTQTQNQSQVLDPYSGNDAPGAAPPAAIRNPY